METEVGRSGLNLSSEEFLIELSGRRGIKIYKEMSANDDTIGAVLFAIKNLVRQAAWYVEATGTSPADKKAAQFVESCLHDMSTSWTNTISEILSFLTYGWSLHEIVYKRRRGNSKDPRLRSKYDDGMIGWQKLPLRAQESLYEWEFDGHDNLKGFVQMPAPTYELIRIPEEKFILFRTESHKDNPQGRSILRNAYRAWYFKKRIEELEGIGIERDLAGLPVLIAPEGVDIWSERCAGLLQRCNEFVQNIRRDAAEGLTLPYGWELKLLSAGNGGSRQFDTSKIIERYSRSIAQTMLADFIFLGHESNGSYALSSDKTRLFAMAIGAYLDIICEEMNRVAIPRLLEMNKIKSAIPKLEHGDIETQDLKELAGYVKELAGLGLLESDDDLEEYLRAQAHLPAKKY